MKINTSFLALLLAAFMAVAGFSEGARLAEPWGWILRLPKSQLGEILEPQDSPEPKSYACMVCDSEPEVIVNWLESECRSRGLVPQVDRKRGPGGDGRGQTREQLARISARAKKGEVTVWLYRALLEDPMPGMRFPRKAPYLFLLVEAE